MLIGEVRTQDTHSTGGVRGVGVHTAHHEHSQHYKYTLKLNTLYVITPLTDCKLGITETDVMM